jgi:hypothetical protein
MMLHSSKWIWAVVATGCMAAGANAQWSDNFDTYASGSVINGQGGWKQWDSAPNATSIILSSGGGFSSHTGANCVGVFSNGVQTSDLVHEYSGYTSGSWDFKAYSYVPSANPAPGQAAQQTNTYFLLLNTYADFGPYDWSVQLTLNASTGTWVVDAGSPATATGSLVLDTWVECKATIDLTANTCEVFYNGVSTAAPYSWTGGVFGGGAGALNLACVDLYKQPLPAGSPTAGGYWDTASLLGGGVPPPTTYCVSKTTGNGCSPTIGFVAGDQASATNAGPFRVNGTNFINNKSCLLFYGGNGTASVPFQGGTLCVAPAIRRTPGTTTGGNPPPNDCSGVPQIDMNLFAVGGLGGSPQPFLTVVGSVVNCQWWGRDPGFPAPNNTQLSNGLEYTVGP